MWRRLFNRRGPSGFSSSSTAEEVTQGIDGTGLTAIVTGTSSGIGAETARVLASRGVHVIMLNKDMPESRDVQEAIVKEFPSAKVEALELDLSSLKSVRKFAAEYNSSGRPLNILINNAGIMGTPFKLSEDKIELQFAINYLGHFQLTNLLLDTMKKTWRESNIEGRIVNVSSMSHAWSYPEGIRFEKLNDPSGYGSFAAYGQSKLASLLHANELARRFKEEGVDITANSVHPGGTSTSIGRDNNIVNESATLPIKLQTYATWHIVSLEVADSESFKNMQLNAYFRETMGHPAYFWLLGIRSNMLLSKLAKFLAKDIPHGAATTCYVALNPQVKGVSGEYFSDCNIKQPSKMGKDLELAKKLWDFSMDLVK